MEPKRECLSPECNHDTGNVFGSLNVVQFIAQMFRCRHRDMSRPFTLAGESYRVCLQCGARRQFIFERWESVGEYYYHPGSDAQEPGPPHRQYPAGAETIQSQPPFGPRTLPLYQAWFAALRRLPELF